MSDQPPPSSICFSHSAPHKVPGSSTPTLRSTILIGAGLGSSASVCVCLSTALLLQSRTLAGPHTDQPRNEAEIQIERINHWTYVGELCIHGDPSGVDNTVSSSGKAVLFQKNPAGGPSSVTALSSFPQLRFLLVHTHQPCSTAPQVQKVHTLQKGHPIATNLVLDAIGQVTASALELFSSASFNTTSKNNTTNNNTNRHNTNADDSNSTNNDDTNGPHTNAHDDALNRLGTLMIMNHGLLDALGVSHPRLQRVRELAEHSGLGWAKLTGAGGGGCAIVLLRADASPEALERLEREFLREGFRTYEAVLGAQGVGVLWPAVVRAGEGLSAGGGERGWGGAREGD